MSCEINIRNVSVFLSGEKILDNLSLQVEAGHFVGIIGPNGAGKSTFFKMLLGQIPAQKGSVELLCGGRAMKPGEIVGYVPQSRQIDAETPISAWDFVSLNLPDRFRPWMNKKDRQTVNEAFRLTRSEHLAHKPIGKMSGGERQRIFLAQALVREPKLLLLDEPTSSLDPGAQEIIASVVDQICRERGITVLFISHDINLIAKYADRILFLTRRHYAIGPVAEIMRSDVLSRLYGTPVEVHVNGSKYVMTSSAEPDKICHHEESIIGG